MTDGTPTSEEVLVDNPVRQSAPRLNQLFEIQVKSTPHATALVHNSQFLTYLELDRRANQLAHHLRSLGAGPEVTIGVCVPRSFNMIIALLAILKAGAAYVPLDLRAPLQRLAYMLEDSAAIILITSTTLIKGLAFSGVVLDLDAETDIIERAPEDQVASLGNAENLAYVMYTSGSTGMPKGVMLTHTAANLVVWARDTFSREDIARVAATTSLGFGPSVQEIFIPLCLGGSVIIKDNLLQPFADDEQPTMLYGSPTVLSQLLAVGQIPESVRLINVGGEIVRGALVQRVYAASKVQRILVHYGPTEATNCTTVASVPRSMLEDPPVGKPVYGIEIYVLNSNGQVVGDGEVGEIHIGGKNLARGYQNKAALTTSCFIANPFAPPGERMYRTGDLGRWSKTGDLVSLGRIDDQVKISGVRVELKEIEAALLRIEGVRQSAVAVANDAVGRPRLVAYIETDEPLVPREIRQALSAWLPAAMIPPSYMFLKKFPLNLSGKIDRVSLLQIKQPLPTVGSQQVEPSVFLSIFRLLQARLPSHAKRRQSIETATALAVETAWRRTLIHAPLDNDVSWTDAGGDSLGMLQLLLRLEQALDRKLGFDLLSSEMTQRELIDRLLEDDFANDVGSSLPVVHLVPGISGDQPSLARFRFVFDGTVRFKLVEPPDLKADGAILRSLEETARRVAQDIQERQPTGSIILAGFSFGGTVAFEAAKQILENGRHVALLIVLDSLTHVELGDDFFTQSQSKTSYSWLKGPSLKLADFDIVRRALIASARLLGHLRMSEFTRLLLRVFRLKAIQSWRPVALSVPALIVLSEEIGSFSRSHWTRLVPGCTFVDIPGTHGEFLASRALAKYKPILLKSILDAASNKATA